jgi:hypothetical protein
MHELRQMHRDTDCDPMWAKGVETLHTTCLTLVKSPPELIRSISLLVALDDFPIPATSLVDLAERVAAEYGLIAVAELKGRFLNVHVLRPTIPAAEPVWCPGLLRCAFDR